MPQSVEIIFAEDNDRFRKAIINELKEYGINTVAEAKNGKELLSHLLTKKPDIVLLDLEMPEMDGNEAFKVIKQRFPETKVIILSFHNEPGLINNFISRGVNAFLCKDFIASNIESLVEVIRIVRKSEKFFHTEQLSKLKYTKREAEVIPMLCNGKTNKEIANELGLGQKSVEKLRTKIYRKTNSKNAAEFFKYSFKNGLDFLGN